ncbi:MAG: hypothetical protein HZB66_00310 [Candidatus Aenigmarchaeota archaeon]|nr:hypothetical protein [Candidatus Aenigmarchaeota archaeon]
MLNVENTNRLLAGAFLGMLVISLFMPVFIVFGINTATSLILFYLSPLTGVLTAYVLGEKSTKPVPEKTAEEKTRFSSFLGKNISVYTSDGMFRGRLREMTDKMLILDNASRAEDAANKLDRIFIELADIRRVETNETHF